MILPTTEYDIPLCLQQYLHQHFNKIIDGLTGASIALTHAKYQYIKSQEMPDDADNNKKMIARFEHVNDLIQQLGTYVSRQRYNTLSAGVDADMLDNCNVRKIITVTHLPLISRAAVKWCNSQNFPVQAPKIYSSAALQM